MPVSDPVFFIWIAHSYRPNKERPIIGSHAHTGQQTRRGPRHHAQKCYHQARCEKRGKRLRFILMEVSLLILDLFKRKGSHDRGTTKGRNTSGWRTFTSNRDATHSSIIFTSKRGRTRMIFMHELISALAGWDERTSSSIIMQRM